MERSHDTRQIGRTLGRVSTWAVVAAVALGACQDAGLRVVLPKDAPALHRAVVVGDAAAVTRLGKADPDARGPYGWTGLHLAAIGDQPAVARKLLELRANVNALDGVSMTPLHWAARRGNTDMVELLLEAGADVAALNKFDMTPLHEASRENVAELLLEAGADLKARDVDGFTPLHTAPNKKVAELLIDRGADINARARDGRTPMEMPPMAVPRTGAPGAAGAAPVGAEQSGAGR